MNFNHTLPRICQTQDVSERGHAATKAKDLIAPCAPKEASYFRAHSEMVPCQPLGATKAAASVTTCFHATAGSQYVLRGMQKPGL